MSKKRKHMTIAGPAWKKVANKRPRTNAATTSSGPKAKAKPRSRPPQHPGPTIPFSPYHNILLVGEGDLSFAASLITHHGCKSVRASVLEASRDELIAKYPHAAENLTIVERHGLEAPGCGVIFGLDATKMKPFIAPQKRNRRRKIKAAGKFQDDQQKMRDYYCENGDADGGDEDENGEFVKEQSQGNPKPKPGAPILDRIIFNFPHVGGKSKDVNRQVRANQALLVQFFERAMPSLAPGGRIVVTLFEGEPYLLWNIKDLARHVGLVVERSFKFEGAAYPGYRHARTLGVVKRIVRAKKRRAVHEDNDCARDGGEKGEEPCSDEEIDCSGEEEEAEEEEEEDGDDDNDEHGDDNRNNSIHDGSDSDKLEESTTAWRGEHRPARSYVFIRKDDDVALKTELSGCPKQSSKRKKGNDDASSNDDV